jgi:uncharacterized protein
MRGLRRIKLAGMKLDQPLSENELDELDRFLDSDATPVDWMGLSMLEGFLTALAIGPTVVLPSEWVPQVWGEHDDDLMLLESEKDAERVAGLLVRFYNGIVATFREAPEKFAPLLSEWDNRGKPARSAEDWCIGFMRGVSLRLKDWEPLVADDQTGGLFELILQCALGKDKRNPLGRQQAGSARKLQGFLGYIAQRIHAFWQPRREKRKPGTTTETFHLAGPPAVAREPEVGRNHPREPKVGRNAPCPCGSGKKFKKCCGDTRT